MYYVVKPGSGRGGLGPFAGEIASSAVQPIYKSHIFTDSIIIIIGSNTKHACRLRQ
jgi:hypothetical protein